MSNTNTESSSFTHMTGPLIVLLGRAIQRCPICGHKMVDVDSAREKLKDGQIPMIGVWTPGTFIRFHEDGKTEAVDGHCLNHPPHDICLDLVE